MTYVDLFVGNNQNLNVTSISIDERMARITFYAHAKEYH